MSSPRTWNQITWVSLFSLLSHPTFSACCRFGIDKDDGLSNLGHSCHKRILLPTGACCQSLLHSPSAYCQDPRQLLSLIPSGYQLPCKTNNELSLVSKILHNVITFVMKATAATFMWWTFLHYSIWKFSHCLKNLLFHACSVHVPFTFCTSTDLLQILCHTTLLVLISWTIWCNVPSLLPPQPATSPPKISSTKIWRGSSQSSWSKYTF